MKTILPLLILLWLAACGSPAPTVAEAPVIPLANQRVLILGNSITQNGLYVSYLEYYLRRAYPAATFDLISIGLSSETVSCLTEPDHPFPRPCLRERLGRALEKVQPDLVLACYGMNDGIYHPPAPERMQAYQTGIRNLRTAVAAADAQLILLTPPPFDPQPISGKLVGIDAPEFGYATPYEGYDEVLDGYAQWLLSRQDSSLRVIDLHGPINAYVAEKRLADPAFTLSQDGIHPGAEGHDLMARTILAGLGGTLPAEHAAGPQFDAVAERRKLRSEAWLPYVGYIRGDTVFAESIEEAEQAAVIRERAIQALFNP